MPAVFLGHGNPMLTLGGNRYADAWAALGAALPRPRAILCVSAHWYVPELAATAMPRPRTIHDFGGFPEALFRVQYPAPGDPALAACLAERLAPLPVAQDQAWGIDHGTWSVLRHLYPAADVPVVQLSIDLRQPPAYHHDVGRRLAPLREDGVLIVGSGNIVHNLRRYAWDAPTDHPFDWAERFDRRVRDHLLAGEDAALIDYPALPDAALAIPTPDHYLPLLYILGLRRPDEAVSFPVEGYDGGSMSMRAVQIG